MVAPSTLYEIVTGEWSPPPVMVTVVAALCQPEWVSAARLVAWAQGFEMLTQPVWKFSMLPAASVDQ